MTGTSYSEPLPAALAANRVDEALLSMPAPPRGRRLLAMISMAAVVATAIGLLTELRFDLGYRFTSDRVLDLGAVTQLDLAALPSNRYVRIRGTPMLSRMVRYERTLWGSQYALFPLAGQRQVFVQVPAAALSDPTRAAQGEFRGRLLTFGQLGGRMRSVRDYLAGGLGLPVTNESFVLLAEEPPSAYGWALAVGALCVGVIALMAWLMLRWFRPIPSNAGLGPPLEANKLH